MKWTKGGFIEHNTIYFLLLLTSSFFLEWKCSFFWYHSTKYSLSKYNFLHYIKVQLKRQYITDIKSSTNINLSIEIIN